MRGIESFVNVVVVESPAKAKTINKYLGSGYTVLASYGHVRDLPPKDGSVRPDEDFAMDWEVDGKAERRLKEIAAAVKNADKLILATDPDREGEAISWHISEELKRRRALIVQSARSGAVCCPTAISRPPLKTRHVIPIEVPGTSVAQ